MSLDSAHVIESEFRPGQLFAERYRVLDVLPSGSGGTIYLALDETVNQRVLLKLIRPSTVPRESEVLTRYRFDLNSMRQIAHQNVIRIFDFGEYAGRVYLVVEPTDGVRLSEYLKQSEKPSLSEFFKLLTGLCNALAQLHFRNVIYRDLHPDNIVITKSGSLKLMDFGIDRDFKQRAKPNSVRGIEYAAPEQLAGHAPSVATDIYSLGAVCYTILTGRSPATISRSKDWASSGKLRQELRGSPGELVTVLEKCLQQDPAKRYQSVGALQRAVSTMQNLQVAGSSKVSLDSLRRDTPADPDMCVRIFLKIIGCLREMHAAGTSHAELSAKKIWLQGDDVEIDQAPALAGQGTLLIRDAKYSAPELLMAQTAPDEASHTAADIYVLGLTLYELVAGNTTMMEQFADIAQVGSGLGWMRWHVEPEQKLLPLTKIVPDCPEPLSDLLERMLEKNPAKRIRTLDEIETQLKAMLTRMEKTDQILASSVATTPVSDKPGISSAKRKPARAAIPAFLAVVLLASLAAGGWWLSKGPFFRKMLTEWQGRWRPKASASYKPGTAVAYRRALAELPPAAQTSTGIMALIPRGEFLMGDDAIPNAAPAHKVSLPPYYINRLEISNLEYRKFCQKTSRAFPPKPDWDPGYFGRDEYPVVSVTWQDARAFCESYNQRLPSEAEWEKAARGTEPFVHWANWTLPGISNIAGIVGHRPAPVGSFSADVSPYGVLDLAGNVQEWVNDSFRPYARAPDATSGPEDDRKLVRGGSYAMGPEGLSPAMRGWIGEGSGPAQSSSVGFRCAADPEQIAASHP